MTGSWKLAAQFCLVAIGLAASSCFAAGEFATTAAGEETHEQSWNREQKVHNKLDARAIVQQKALVRAEQRQERMASMSWYGMSNSRPNAATTPFTSRYSSVWEMPGGRPYSW